ncbi:MAG: hypothetical protein AABZ47_11540 [Planctomycetota bacterium]
MDENTIQPAPFPLHYTISRGGQVTSVTVADWEQLRSLRTEVELLRAVHQSLTEEGAILSDSLTEASLADDQRDLAGVIADALHPLVHEVADQIDREFPQLCVEGFPTLLGAEAEQLVRAAIQAGVAISEVQAALEPDVSEEEEVDDYTEEAATLDELLDLTSSTVESMADLVSGQFAMTTNNMNQDVTPFDPSHDPSLERSPDDSHPATVELSSASNSTPPDAVELGTSVAASSSNMELNSCTPDEKSLNGEWSSIVPERAVAALDEIERGIRKLSGILSTEVNQQWDQSRQIFDDIQAASRSIQDARQLAESYIAEITRFKEEARIGRDESEVARREAKLFREDARKSKERAENNAAIAELAATQSQQEIENLRLHLPSVSPSGPR